MEDQNDRPKDLNVESLDDLFQDEANENDEDLSKNEENSNLKPETNKIENDIAPMLPQDDEEIRDSKTEEDIMSADIQKELEAKFDELFRKF